MAENLKRRHHAVPRFHLRRFAAVDANREHGQVMRVELPGIKRFRVSVNDASVVKDFYLAPGLDGGLTDAVETSLGELESEAARAVRDIVDDGVWPIPADTREWTASWVVMQHLRAPSVRRRISIVDRLVVNTIGGEGGPHRTLAEQTGEHESVAYRTAHLEAMFAGFLPATRAIYIRGWHLIRFERKALATSDTPVVLTPIPGADERTPLGLTSNGGVLVPLDRRVALLMTEEPGDSILVGNARSAQAFNQWIAFSAWRVLFHHPDDDPLHGVQLPQPQQDVEVRIERLT